MASRRASTVDNFVDLPIACPPERVAWVPARPVRLGRRIGQAAVNDRHHLTSHPVQPAPGRTGVTETDRSSLAGRQVQLVNDATPRRIPDDFERAVEPQLL